ncbi:putative F-box protein at1g67623, partial [Phtheirospermum japonicum]
SCKIFNEITEDKYVYQSVSLDKFPIVHWYPLNEKQKSFLNKCQEYENPELLYRQAVLDYFNKGKRRSACNHLDKAMKLGHAGAQYLTCIIMIICGDPESKAPGIKYLSEFKKSNTKRVTRLCRNNLIKMLGKMWVNNPDLQESSICCSSPNQHRWKNMWCEDDEISSECEACNADREIKMIRRTL